ncbi:MAG: SUMF1/EgtB/PvdO family nonheme iron enzyme [Sandaracinaceae bacterium]|nr:SUMF1/EgtB/PvdO family nonheme iron enzyme [Sandaracinaceae bacterium]
MSSNEETEEDPRDPAYAATGAQPIESDTDPASSIVTDDDTRLARPSLGSVRPDDLLPLSGLEIVELIASGGMGEVHRAHDRALNRDLAMKILHGTFSAQSMMRARFFEEAQVTAQLAHPSIPPVHEVGELPDGRPYFTMKEVHGRTLLDVLADRDEHGKCRLSEQRRLEVFQKICEAVAYAHARGVVHCDLKPPNVMVGAYGEVIVMDWGVARLIDLDDPVAFTEPPVRVAGSDQRQLVAGTPAYMPPEQAIGGEDIGPSADVYALGVMLYELMALKRPYDGSPRELVFLAARGEIPEIAREPGSVVDDTLMEIIRRAMSPLPPDRYAHAGEMAAAFEEWREGAQRREDALGIVRDANRLMPELAPLRERARDLRRRAEVTLSNIDASSDDKSFAWALEDEADVLEREAMQGYLDVTRLLRAAIQMAPDLNDAQDLLADLHFAEHREAEHRREWREAARHETHLREHNRGKYDAYLAGDAPVRIALERPCRISIRRYELRDRRLVAGAPRPLEAAGVIDQRLPVGSYRIELRPEGGTTIAYPIVLRRGEGWEGARPDQPGLYRVPLPRGELADDELVVPAGWFEVGGDPAAIGGMAADRVWLEGFIIQRDPVRFGDFVRFLVADEAAAYRESALREGDGVWRPDSPAVGVRWEAARAYARWLSRETGQRWTLPSELQWEKAARGVDGRAFPWGEFGDGSFCHVRDRGRAPETAAPIGLDRIDVSPYGVRGTAGNVREWTADGFDRTGPEIIDGLPVIATSSGAKLRSVRGGSYRLSLNDARLATRVGLDASRGYPDVGFRLVRPL